MCVSCKVTLYWQLLSGRWSHFCRPANVPICVFLSVYQFRAVRFWSRRMCACGLQCVSPKFSSGMVLPLSLAVSQRRLFSHLSWGSRPSFHSEIYAKTIIPNCRITLLEHSSKAHYNLCWFTKPRFLTDWKRETEIIVVWESDLPHPLPWAPNFTITNAHAIRIRVFSKPLFEKY